MKTIPSRNPLSMLTDQLFVASSKAVRVPCKERKPTDNLITIYYHLGIGAVGLKHFFFENLRDKRDNGNWTIIVEARFHPRFSMANT